MDTKSIEERANQSYTGKFAHNLSTHDNDIYTCGYTDAYLACNEDVVKLLSRMKIKEPIASIRSKGWNEAIEHMIFELKTLKSGLTPNV